MIDKRRFDIKFVFCHLKRTPFQRWSRESTKIVINKIAWTLVQKSNFPVEIQISHSLLIFAEAMNVMNCDVANFFGVKPQWPVPNAEI